MTAPPRIPNPRGEARKRRRRGHLTHVIATAPQKGARFSQFFLSAHAPHRCELRPCWRRRAAVVAHRGRTTDPSAPSRDVIPRGDLAVCRLLGWATRTPTSLHRLLGHDDTVDFTELSGLHGDGWGLARGVPGGVDVRKRANTARMSDDFALWSRATRSGLGLVHLRRATLGLPVRAENTHPFTDGRLAFAHNGSISPPPALDVLLSPTAQAMRTGDT